MMGETNLKACLLISIFLLGMACASASARTISVDDDGPADFNTIQAAINDANDGDTIIVSDGTYTGDGNRDIDFLGKAITLRSENGPENCIIDCQGSEADKHRGFYFHSGEGADSVLDGFTITDGYASHGGGIRCDGGSSPTIRNCNIISNSGLGGGMYFEYSSPHITNCLITNNVAPWVPGFPGYLSTRGGGIASDYGSPVISNCVITENSATDSGGGAFFYKGNPVIENCIITDNSTDFDGGGIGCYSECVMTVRNCILWGNTAARYGPQITVVRLLGYPSFTISFSDVQGGRSQVYTNWAEGVNWGTGNIDAEPLFANTTADDYHLKSQAGRWEPSAQVWVQDEVTSPCIDEGDPGSPIGNEPFPNGGIINMGAYGGTSEASKSYFGRPVCEIIVAGDVNGDCIVNYLDFRLMGLNWLRDESP